MFSSYKIIFLEQDKVLLYKNFSFYVKYFDNDGIRRVGRIHCGLIKKLLSKIRLTNRLLRLEPRSTCKVADDMFVCCFLHKIWRIDIIQNQITLLQENRNGWSDPLSFLNAEANIFWGEYGTNHCHEKVNIYRLLQDGRIDIVFSFPCDSIRHIHNIIYDYNNEQFWILTGDNEKQAGIYKADKNWTQVIPIKIGGQKYRTVVAFPYEDGIIYATDSVETENHIYLLTSQNRYDPIPLISINGSCIYGTEIKDYYVFSTTVEPPEGRGYTDLFSKKLGNGIKSNEVHLIIIRKTDLTDIRIIRKYEKDCWPMKPFQYGAITFPQKTGDSNELWIYPIACKKVDGKNIKVEL